MARRGRVPDGALMGLTAVGCAVYVGCCLFASSLVEEMRNFPETSRTVMTVLLLGFAAGAALLAWPLLRARAWAVTTAIVVGGLGVVLFGFLASTSGTDPEWIDASHAATAVAGLVAGGCAALTVAGIASALLTSRREAAPPRSSPLAA